MMIPTSILVSWMASIAYAGMDNFAKQFSCDEPLDENGECPGEDIFRKFNPAGHGGQSLINSIEKLNEYGCWCYFQDDHGRGKAQPVDALDEVCKILHDGYECAMRDAEEEGTTCIPWEVEYDAGVGGSNTLLMNEQCAGANPGNNCAIRACIIEGSFVANVLEIFVSGGTINPNNRHSGGFDPSTECIVKKNGGGPSIKQCCGQYPERFPFKTVGGDRKCCGNRTYNSLTLRCCSAETNTVKFNC